MKFVPKECKLKLCERLYKKNRDLLKSFVVVYEKMRMKQLQSQKKLPTSEYLMKKKM